MNLTTWTPGSVLLVILIGFPVVCSCVAGAAVAIISARKGNTAAAQTALDSVKGAAALAALEALDKTGVPRQLTSLGAQMNKIALQTPSPQPSPGVQKP